MVRDKIVKALQKATGEDEISLEIPENPEFGDYSSNIALQGKNVKEVAQAIAEKLQKDKGLMEVIEKVEVAGPARLPAGQGFINFWLKKEVLLENLGSVLKEKDKYGSSSVGKGKTVLVEYSSPNIAKRFGIGQLRSTIIGQAIYNLYQFLGYKTIGENHLGDWGTQFGTILCQISKVKSQKSNLTIDELEKLYVDFNKEAEGKPELWEEARGWFKKLEAGDKKAREIWEKVREISLAEFERIYTRLGVKIDHAHGESFYEDKMGSIVKDFRDKGLSKKSQGAEIVELADLPPAMLVKSDGATTYFTRDLAALKFRLEKWHPEAIIYEVGSDQILHFKQVFAAASAIGWIKNEKLIHIAHGLVRFKEGKMSTRKGITVKLEEVLEEAITRAKAIIETSETGRGLSQKDKNKVAEAVGIGSVKYFDLRHHPTSDIIFDWQKILVLEGNSAPYLQYTVARTQSVVHKAHKQLNSLTVQRLNSEESLILRALIHFPEIIEIAAKTYSPNLLTNYLFDLAQKFNTFYARHRILGDDTAASGGSSTRSNFRVVLTEATGQVLKNGLTLLGIQAPPKM